ncbi:hypothetical protein DDZ14_08540 [Maritimibacter sp. 55A14]|uniref:DUF1833 family protein n=1 Tax=Maritimibacter sp. 55A14 TaxID=2174844 RepID=UPI000D61BC11|nr:DUF1833 family protein [Maritimibacter sp. 55A14]PWE32784.1 hypothetical protein DDZ14_08540 [Maritimibacter sp. 55A14]
MTERSLTPAQIADSQARTSPHAYLGFMLIDHPQLPDPIRVVSDVVDYVWQGETWTAIPFEPRPVTDTDGPPSVELSFQNIDWRIGEALARTNVRARVSLYILSSADFDLTVTPRAEIGTPDVIYSHFNFELTDVDVTAAAISGRLRLRDFSSEPYGIDAVEFPGLFA